MDGSPASGESLAHYRLVDKIGEGGMGVVYKAWDTRLERDVALKLLRPDVLRHDQTRGRLIREARLASSLNHPYIATIYDLELIDGRDVIAMEFVRGETLGQRLRKGPIELGEALKLAVAIADGLSEAHDNGVVHRDLKPDNIIVTPRGYPKIMDFGLAKLVQPELRGDSSTQLTLDGAIMGTPAYMSPEQAAGRETSASADIFSFGVVLYELLTRQQAFPGNSDVDILYRIINKDPQPVSEINPDVPSDLQTAVDQCTAKDPRLRYKSAQDLYDALKLVQVNLDVQRARTLDTLSAISREMASILDLEPLLDRIATVVKGLIDYDVLGIFRVDQAAERLYWLGGFGYVVERARDTVYPVGRGICGRALRNRETIRVGDVRKDPDYYPPNGEAFLSNLVVPLLHKGRLIAVINMESSKAHFFTREHSTIMTTLAAPISGAIANADLFEERRRHAALLHDISREVSSILDLDSLLDRVGSLTRKIIDYEMFGILLIDSETNEFSWRRAIGYDEDLVRDKKLKLGDGIIGRAVEKQEPVIVNDTAEDPDFIPAMTQDGRGSRSELALPLISQNKILGVLNLECVEPNRFQPEHVDLMMVLANQVAVAVENARLYREINRRAQAGEDEAERFRRRFESYVTPHIAEQVFGDPDGKTLAGERREVTILVADIHGFTKLVEQGRDEDIVKLIRDFFSLASHIVFKYEGTVDKFLGDALMAFYGAPIPHDPRYGPSDSQRAVFAALDLRDAFQRLRDKWWKSNDAIGALDVSIGINTGKCLLGNMGSDKRVEYTAVGEPVNHAFRLCRAAAPGEILIGGSTHTTIHEDVKVKPAEREGLAADPAAHVVVGLKYLP